MTINPYLQFNGNCEAAFKFYEKCLGGKIAFQTTYAETPMADKVPAELRGKIIHARFVVGDQVLMGSDAVHADYSAPKGINVTIGIANPEEAEKVFAALSEKATITMPIQETFWALRFGMLVDQFGIPWMINCEKAS